MMSKFFIEPGPRQCWRSSCAARHRLLFRLPVSEYLNVVPPLTVSVTWRLAPASPQT
jgi:hypothetical protein